MALSVRSSNLCASFHQFRKEAQVPMSSTNQLYNFSLTGAYLLLPLSMDFAELYETLQDWDLVREKVVAENILQGQREKTNEKRLQVVTSRLETLSEEDWEVYLDGTTEDKRQIIFMAAARFHRIIREFVVEVLREKYLVYDTKVLPSDFEIFWRSKVAQHPELESIQDATQRKIRNVLFSMLVDAGWLEGSYTEGFQLTPPLPSERLIRVLVQTSPAWLLLFCMPDRDIEFYLKKYAGDKTA